MLNPYLCLDLCKNSPINPPMGSIVLLKSRGLDYGSKYIEKEKYKICISLIGDKGVAQ